MATTSLVQRFLTQLQADGRSPHTVAQYKRHLRLLGDWWVRESPGGDVRSLTHEAVAEFLVSDEALLRPDGAPKVATSMNTLRSSVRGFFGYLERSGQLASNPARVVRMARVPENPPEPLKPSEVEKLLGALAADG